MRNPLGTYFARPSGHDSFAKDSGLIHLWPYLAGIVADSICCQILWRHSLAALDEAVKTIFGDPNDILRVEGTKFGRNAADSSTCGESCQAQCGEGCAPAVI